MKPLIRSPNPTLSVQCFLFVPFFFFLKPELFAQIHYLLEFYTIKEYCRLSADVAYYLFASDVVPVTSNSFSV